MPRPRKYTTAEENQQAIRERSRKYYEKNAEAIRERKRRLRALNKRGESPTGELVPSLQADKDINFSAWMFPENPDAEINELDAIVEWNEWDPLLCLQRVNMLIEHEFRRAGSSGYSYMKTLYRTFSRYLTSGGCFTSTDNPVMISQMRFAYFQKLAQLQEYRTGEWYGCSSDEYVTAKRLSERLIFIVSCMDDFVLSASRGRLEREYKGKRFLFQAGWMYHYLVYTPNVERN
ncbi:hypothetical protein V5O48_016733 [Marasmius crinis-equi]|uniref:Uncharacterized protein n=1 Tax=Marasmius crinis-equi TaxID=585013 RepID=A0ABR3EQW9_9AGAR